MKQQSRSSQAQTKPPKTLGLPKTLGQRAEAVAVICLLAALGALGLHAATQTTNFDPVAATIEVPPGAKVTSSSVGHGKMDGVTVPEWADVVDIEASGWTARVEPARDTSYASADEAKRHLNLGDADVVLTRSDGDGWALAWSSKPGEIWVLTRHKVPDIVCNTQGTVATRRDVDDLVRMCGSIR